MSTHKKKLVSSAQPETIRVGKYLNELIVIKDEAGNIIHKFLRPSSVEFYPHDIMQVIVGATILAIPLSYTQEVWDMGLTLSNRHAMFIALSSLICMGLFIYYQYYRHKFLQHCGEWLKRVVITYVVAVLVAWLILFLIEKTPLSVDYFITLKRIILVAFPASMSAALTDTIK